MPTDIPLSSDLLIERLCDEIPQGSYRVAIFDFDGTLSLLRRNWQDVMIPMFVDELAATDTTESRQQLNQVVEDFVMRLNGRQTIYQMIQLVDEIRKRGGRPLDPLDYKSRYHEQLAAQVGPRIQSVLDGNVSADEMTVPGARSLLDGLRQRGIELYLTSGTDLKYVQQELGVLGLDEFFGPRVFGALDDYKKFSKAMIIRHVLSELNLEGAQVMGFGDGFVEICETKKVGGLAIGVASNEVERCGMNAWKRERLIRAGADVIIGDYRHQDRLFEMLGID